MASQRPSETSDRILDAALRLVQVQGWNGFSYADIAAQLNIRKASLHHHFPTKAHLGMALVARYQDAFVQALDKIHAGKGTAIAKLKAYTRIYTQVLRNERMCLCGMLAADFETLPKQMRAGVHEFFRVNEAWLTNLLEEGRRGNVLHFAGTASHKAAFFVSALEGAMLVARTFGDVARFQSVVNNLLGGLSTPEIAKPVAS